MPEKRLKETAEPLGEVRARKLICIHFARQYCPQKDQVL